MWVYLSDNQYNNTILVINITKSIINNLIYFFNFISIVF